MEPPRIPGRFKGIFAGAGSRNVSVIRGSVANCVTGVSFFDSANPVVDSTNVVGGTVGIVVSARTSATVRNVTIEGASNAGIGLTGSAAATLTDCHVDVPGAAVMSLSGSRLMARRSRLRGSFAAFYLITQAEFDLHNNQILPGGSFSVLLGDYPGAGSPAVLDFSENYWGTSDPDSVASLIWDGNDDPAIHAVVDFEPLLNAPIATESKSMSQLKALFEGRQ